MPVGYEPEGRVFESPRAHHFQSDIAPLNGLFLTKNVAPRSFRKMLHY